VGPRKLAATKADLLYVTSSLNTLLINTSGLSRSLNWFLPDIFGRRQQTH
jgi:hypothetical protein